MAMRPLYGKAEARRMLPELVGRARDGETILIGMRGVPEAKLVSYLVPTVSDVELATLARGLGEAQAHRMFQDRTSTKGDGEESVMRVVPDSLAADVVEALVSMPSGRDFAAEFVTSLAITTRRLYQEASEDPPSLDRLLVGISMSAGGHPVLYEQLVETVMPKVATILRHVADADRAIP